MRKQLLKIVFISLLLSKDLFALFGAGDIVSDPTSYTYYAKQLTAFNDSIKTATESLDQLNIVNDTLDKANDLIFNSGEKLYNPSKSILKLVSNLEGIQNKFSNMSEKAKNIGMERFIKDYHDIGEALSTEEYDKFKESFISLFNNGEDEKYQELNQKVLNAVRSKNYSKYEDAVRDLDEYVKLKNIEKEELKKYALLAPMEVYNDAFLNEESVSERENKLERIKALAEQVDSEKDLMKQQQTTNQILLEVLSVIQSQYDLQMKFSYAISMNLISDKSNLKYDLSKVKDIRENYQDSNDSKLLRTEAKKSALKFFKKYEDIGKESLFNSRLGEI